MMSGWQDNRANAMPEKAVEMMVSEMPISSLVLSTADGQGSRVSDANAYNYRKC